MCYPWWGPLCCHPLPQWQSWNWLNIPGTTSAFLKNLGPLGLYSGKERWRLWWQRRPLLVRIAERQAEKHAECRVKPYGENVPYGENNRWKANWIAPITGSILFYSASFVSNNHLTFSGVERSGREGPPPWHPCEPALKRQSHTGESTP